MWFRFAVTVIVFISIVPSLSSSQVVSPDRALTLEKTPIVARRTLPGEEQKWSACVDIPLLPKESVL